MQFSTALTLVSGHPSQIIDPILKSDKYIFIIVSALTLASAGNFSQHIIYLMPPQFFH
jgi:hypothetical protein